MSTAARLSAERTKQVSRPSSVTGAKTLSVLNINAASSALDGSGAGSFFRANPLSSIYWCPTITFPDSPTISTEPMSITTPANIATGTSPYVLVESPTFSRLFALTPHSVRTWSATYAKISPDHFHWAWAWLLRIWVPYHSRESSTCCLSLVLLFQASHRLAGFTL